MEDIATLQALLIAKQRPDLADLFIRASSRLEPTTTYGSQWHSFLATFILEVPAQVYFELRNLSAEDYHIICSCIKELYPPLESSYEIDTITLSVQKERHAYDIRRSIRYESLARSWIKRAKTVRQVAEQHSKNKHFAEAISMCQECIELTLKALYALILHSYPKQHDFTDAECKQVLTHAPHSLRNVVPKLFMYVRFWRQFYALAKYGHEVLLIGPEQLFGAADVQLAIHHADSCLAAAESMLMTTEPKSDAVPSVQSHDQGHTPGQSQDSEPRPP